MDLLDVDAAESPDAVRCLHVDGVIHTDNETAFGSSCGSAWYFA